jgi:hypothetical protein
MISPRLLFQGDPTECIRWVGLAKKFARQAYNAEVISKVWKVSEGVTIRVMNNLQARVCKVWIEAGEGIGYQFYGTEGTMLKTFEDPNIPGRWLPLGNWLFVKPYLSREDDVSVVKFKASPLLSSLREDTTSPPRWVYNPNPYLSIQPEGDYPLKIKPVHQPDGMGVKKWQNTQRPKTWLTSCWAEPTPNQAVSVRSGAASWFTITGLTDQGYDLAPGVFKSPKGKRRAPDSDWYRGACLHTATHEIYGSRLFVVMVDISHRFYCYPAEVAETETGAISGKPCVGDIYIQQQGAPLPAWVTLFDVGIESGLTPKEHNAEIQPQWVFSPNGDKAAAVMFHLDEAWSDAYHTSTRYEYDAGTDTTTDKGVRESRPGVVEVEWTIALTGENPEDFDFSVALKQSLYSEDDGRGYLAVGYASQDFVNLPGGALYNGLLILEQDYYLGELFSQAALYATPELPVTNTALNIITHPPVAVVAKVTYESSTIMQWLSSYTVFSNNSYRVYGGIDPASLIAPTFDDLTDKPATAANTQTFCLQTHINAMDLPTLTFCFGVSASLTGVCTAGGYFLTEFDEFIQWDGPFSASAAYVVMYALGVKDEERFVGHSQLKAVLPAYFDMTHTHPDLDAMVRVNLNATISSTAFSPTGGDLSDLYRTVYYRIPPVWGAEYGEPNDYYQHTEFADLTLDTGFIDESFTESVIQASSLVRSYATNFTDQLGLNLLASTPFDVDSWMTTLPRIFLMFDGQYYERPGLRWMRKVHDGDFWRPNGYPDPLVMEAGTSDFSGYPLGLVLHTRFAHTALFPLNNPYANLSAEPNGSYAIFFGPFAAATSTVATHPNISQPVPQLTGDFVIEQNFMDVIRVRLPQGSGYHEGKTSHREQMNEAFELSLTPSDYSMSFVIESGRLRIAQKAEIPVLIDRWDVHSRYDRNYMSYLGNQYAGSISLYPINAAWLKTTYALTVDTYLMQTLPCFHTTDLLEGPPGWTTVFPTPRMEGLFTQLPIVKEV